MKITCIDDQGLTSVFSTLSALYRKAKPSAVMWTMSSGICEHSTIAPMDVSGSSRLTTIAAGSLSL